MGGFSFPNAANTFTTTMNIPVPTANTVVTMPTTGTVVSSTEPMSGMVIQVANFTTGALATGTIVVPFDDTIPQNTEGVQFLSLSFTPKKANSLLRIDIVANVAHSAITYFVASLFRDAGPNSIGTASIRAGVADNGVLFSYQVYANSSATTITTFNVRIGGAAVGTITLNGVAGARYLGGSLASSITITEIAQ